MIDLKCKCEIEQPCSPYTFLRNIIKHSGIDADLVIKSCDIKNTLSDSDACVQRSVVFMDMMKDIKESISEEIDLIHKFKPEDGFNLCSIFQRLIFSIEIAMFIGQQSSSCELKVASDSFSSLSKLISEMSNSLGDDVTPGEYDEKEWDSFCIQYRGMLKTLVILFESQSIKRAK